MNEKKQILDDDQPVPVMPYSPSELWDLYCVSRHIWRRWFRKIKEDVGPRQGRYYNIQQVRIIFEKLDPPPTKAERESNAQKKILKTVRKS